MTIPMLLTWLLSAMALAGSIIALVVALRSSDRSLLKRYVELSTRFSELEAAAEAQQGKLRSMSVRLSSVVRKNPASADATPETGPMTESQKDEWQRRTNREIALKRLR